MTGGPKAWDPLCKRGIAGKVGGRCGGFAKLQRSDNVNAKGKKSKTVSGWRWFSLRPHVLSCWVMESMREAEGYG